jgi:hypothetical protein
MISLPGWTPEILDLEGRGQMGELSLDVSVGVC